MSPLEKGRFFEVGMSAMDTGQITHLGDIGNNLGGKLFPQPAVETIFIRIYFLHFFPIG
jgi:hypothetical protein